MTLITTKDKDNNSKEKDNVIEMDIITTTDPNIISSKDKDNHKDNDNDTNGNENGDKDRIMDENNNDTMVTSSSTTTTTSNQIKDDDNVAAPSLSTSTDPISDQENVFWDKVERNSNYIELNDVES